VTKWERCIDVEKKSYGGNKYMQSTTLFVRRQGDEKIIETERYIGEEADLVISFTALPRQRFIHDVSSYFSFLFVFVALHLANIIIPLCKSTKGLNQFLTCSNIQLHF
jgi:hypothetical protein